MWLGLNHHITSYQNIQSYPDRLAGNTCLVTTTIYVLLDYIIDTFHPKCFFLQTSLKIVLPQGHERWLRKAPKNQDHLDNEYCWYGQNQFRTKELLFILVQGLLGSRWYQPQIPINPIPLLLENKKAKNNRSKQWILKTILN